MDPKLEFKAPQFVDFDRLDESAVDHEMYFGKYVYLFNLFLWFLAAQFNWHSAVTVNAVTFLEVTYTVENCT